MFGERLVELRKEHGYNRTQFANKIGIPSTTLRNYENGSREPGHSFLILIGKEFNVSVDYLLGLTEERKVAAYNAAIKDHVIGENLSDELSTLWNNATDEGRQAAMVLLKGYQKSGAAKNIDEHTAG